VRGEEAVVGDDDEESQRLDMVFLSGDALSWAQSSEKLIRDRCRRTDSELNLKRPLPRMAISDMTNLI
jgi:hypothetical protein